MRWHISLLAVAVVMLPVAVSAQVVQNNIGQALDANYQIGSGGYNTVNGGQGGVNSQLYINRQVTGLSYFHGRTPIEAANQLRVSVPSAAMGDFVRISMGVPQVLTSSGYVSAPYYNPANTVFGVPGIQAGLTPPGSSAATGQISQVAVRRIYSQVMQAYQPLLPPGQEDAPTILSGEGVAMATPMTIISRPGSTAMFGVPQYAQGTELATGIRRFLQDRTDGRTPSEDRTDLGIGTDQTLGGTNFRELKNSTRGGKESAIPLANQDAYLDLLLSLQRQIEEEKKLKAPPVKPGEAPGEYSPGSGREVQKPGNEPGRTEPGDTPETPGSVPGQLPPLPDGKPLVERNKSGVVIHGLAGLSPDLFNVYMNRARKLIKEGKYYEASRQYEMANIVDRNNPMASLGAGLAVFTAGEPFSAAIHIRKAMTLLPPLMETKVDLASIVKLADLQVQLGTLDERIADKNGNVDPLLLYISAFMHQNLGQTEKAKAAARMLEGARTEDKRTTELYKAYANYVLTGQRPTTQPTTAP